MVRHVAGRPAANEMPTLLETNYNGRSFTCETLASRLATSTFINNTLEEITYSGVVSGGGGGGGCCGSRFGDEEFNTRSVRSLLSSSSSFILPVRSLCAALRLQQVDQWPSRAK